MRGSDGKLDERTTEAGDETPTSALTREKWARVEDLLGRVREASGDARPQLGRFIVHDVLGRGGMGVVLAAHDPRLDRRVALKLVDDSRSDALGEARALARMSHPHIVGVYEVGEVDDVPFIAMELVQGRTLRAWLAADDAPDRRTLLEAFLAIARGLYAAHESGIVHRDFKPDNVLVGHDGRPRVVDFGLSQLREVGDAPRWLVGTPAYMAAEQWYGRTADARSDQFAFCVALYEALYGRRPFSGDTMAALMQRVTEGEVTEVPASERGDSTLHAAILRGLRTDADERWPSMAEVVRELVGALARMQPGLMDAPPAPARFVVPAILSLAVVWLGLELTGVVEYTPWGWWMVSTVQLGLMGVIMIVLRRMVMHAFRTPRLIALPAIFLPLLLGHRLVAWLTDSSIELMFVYDYLLVAGAGWGVTLVVERGVWPMIVLGLLLTTLGILAPSWAPRLWLAFVLGMPLILALAIARGRARRNPMLRGDPSTR